MAIRILLIDDHSLFRSGVRLLLQRQPDFEVVAEAADGVEGIKRAKEFQPDVILLDLNMPGLSGLETLQLLVQDLPGSNVVIRSEEHTSELQSLMRISYAVFCLKKKTQENNATGTGKRKYNTKSHIPKTPA